MIKIRKINQTEVPAVIEAIDTASWVPESELEPGDYQVENVIQFVSNKDCVLCVAEADGQFAGVAFGFVLKKPHGPTWLYIDEVDVCADKQRQGVGTEIMKFLFDYAKAEGCDEVWLATEHDNVPANALYKSLEPSVIDKCFGYLYKVDK